MRKLLESSRRYAELLRMLGNCGEIVGGRTGSVR